MAILKMDKNKIVANIIKRQAKDRLEEFRQYTLEIESKFNSDKNDLLTRTIRLLKICLRMKQEK